MNGLTMESAKTIEASSIEAQSDIRLVRADKIASSTINLNLSNDIEVVQSLREPHTPRAGDAVVVRTLTDNATYNTIELVSGRMAKINPGDIIAGVLGYRRALKGFVGDVPDSITAGDRLHILNLGGLVGRCLGHHHGLSNAIEVEVIGMPISDGKPLNIRERAIAPLDSFASPAPLVIVAGTCMNSGKTFAAVEIIKHLARAGLKVAGAKLAGVACLRDTLNMQDHGAHRTLSFLDCGLPSTVGLSDISPYAKGIIAELASSHPDCIVVELGDGIMGGYGVSSIFEDRELMDAAAAVVFCASDFVGAWGGRELLAKRGVKIDVLSGPVTDSQMGRDYVYSEFGLPAANATNQSERLSSIVKERLEQWSR